MLACYFQ